VSEGQKAAYLVLGIAIQALFTAWRSLSGGRASDPVLYIASALLLALGVYVCYRANASGDGERFLERYVCLAVPLTIWMLVTGFVIGAVLMYGLGLRDRAYTNASWILSPILWIAYFVAMRWLWQTFRACRHGHDTPSVAPRSPPPYHSSAASAPGLTPLAGDAGLA
jgi:hypothetical protein